MCLSLFIVLSCDNSMRQLKKEMENFLGTEVFMPENLVAVNLPTRINKEDLDSAKYKTICYLDSSECADCSFKRLLPFDSYFQTENSAESSIMLIVIVLIFLRLEILLRCITCTLLYFWM